MLTRRFAFLPAFVVVCTAITAADPQPKNPTGKSDQPSRVARTVSGPTEPMNRAVAAGATTIVTLQPVAPKTNPATSYPPDTMIMGQTLHLGSVPTRVWIDVMATNWQVEQFRVLQIGIDATDVDEDGGGFGGDMADCMGEPMTGAGDLVPARQPCPSANTAGSAVCSAALVGSPTCAPAPSRCVNWDGVSPDYFPAGLFCQPVYQNACDLRWILKDIVGIAIVDLFSINFRLAGCPDLGEIATDFNPSYLGTIVLDVPADAKGNYTIDFSESQTFMILESGGPGIPVVMLNRATISVACGSCCTNLTGAGTCVDGVSEAECNALPTTDTHVYREGQTCAEAECCNCTTHMDCNDNSACTVDTCAESCYCQFTPIAGWNPATECCHPATTVQALIPQSTACRTGTCSMGGSVGVPVIVNHSDGAACPSIDPCSRDGVCQSGACVGEAYAGADCPKVRFISFNAGNNSTNKAYRIRMVSLHHPNPPYLGDTTSDFSAHEGEVRWVGPPSSYQESSSDPTPVYASLTRCQPHYQSWLGYDPLHVTGGEIVPSSEYAVQSIAQGLDINNEANYSAPVLIRTARWADLVIPNSPPGTTIQPDAIDISKVMDKFRSTSQSASKPRALMMGAGMSSVPSLLGDVSFVEISAVVDANRGRGYPYPWPAPCP